MALDPNSILAITQPNLEIRRISHVNPESFESESEVTTDRANNANIQTVTGLIAPYVEIDNYVVPQNRLVSLSINQNGFLPELTLSVIDNTGVFSGMYFPRTNPILKLYIKSLSPAIKPIRSDYLITNIVSSELSTLYTGAGRIESIYTITAKLYVPGIYGNTVQSIPKKKSWEALKSLADHLKLGFATNETSTDDLMTWINPNGTIETFIQDICARAYKNEKSFFGCFIDTNYILNFVNYEKALSKETKVMQTAGDGMESQYSAVNSVSKTESKDDKPKDTELIDVLLSSSITDTHSGFNIAHYAMYSNHGEVLSKQSFRKSITWHDRKFYLENKTKHMLPASIQKNDKLANILIVVFSIIVFVAVVFLSRIKLEVELPFDVHVFAKINAIINSAVSFLLLVGLLAVKRGRYELHKKVMMSAMVLSLLFLVSYICHHLLSESTSFGGDNSSFVKCSSLIF